MTGEPPSLTEVTVALDALQHDAARWALAARDMRAVAGAAHDQDLARSAFCFAGGEVADAYAALRTATVTLMSRGARNCDDIAAALRTSAAAYAAEETAGVHRARGIY